MSIELGKIDNRLLKFFTDVKKEWTNAKILSGYRTCKKQRDLFLQLYGKKPVALPCFSSHNYGFAIDIIGIEWTNYNVIRVKQILKKHPEIKWGIEFKDTPHFYVGSWKKIVLSRFATAQNILISVVILISIYGIIRRNQ